MSTTTPVNPPASAPEGRNGKHATTTEVPTAPAPVAQATRGQQSKDGWLVFVYAVAATALIASLVAVGFGMRAVDEAKDGGGSGTEVAGAASTVTVTLSELKIEPAVVEVAEGGTLAIQNKGALAHDVRVEGTDFVTPLVNSGGSAQLSLAGLAPGTYTIFCQVPGHRSGGMEAQLKILAGSGAAAAGASQPATDHKAMSADEMDTTMAARTAAFPAATKGLGGQVLEPKILADGTKQFDITTTVTQWEVEPGKTVEVYAYNGTVPGPTIQVNPGDKVRFVVKNELPESTVVHFHGLILPNELDGVPDITQKPVKPGQSYTYDFTAQSSPAVGMYHSHHDAQKQVTFGLAGAFLVGDLPLPKGVTPTQEHVMMLNDSGPIGFSLNGKSFPATAPYVATKGEWIEMHYMNEGSQVHPMHLHGPAQLVVAKDGFPLDQPYKADTLLVGPGERYTVLIQADQVGTWAWHCHILSHAENETGMFGMVTALIVK